MFSVYSHFSFIGTNSQSSKNFLLKLSGRDIFHLSFKRSGGAFNFLCLGSVYISR